MAGPRGAWRRFAPYTHGVRGMLAAGLAASVAQAITQWAAPWPLKVIFDSVLGHRSLPRLLDFLPADPIGRLAVLTAATVAIAVALGVSGYAANRWVAHAGQRVVFALRCHLFTHLQSQSVGFHQRRTTGDLISRLTGDTAQIQSLVVDMVPTVLNNVVTLAGMIVIMLILDWQLAVAALAITPILTIAVRYYLRRIKDVQRDALRAQGEAVGIAQEVLTSLPVVQAFGAEELESRRFAAASDAGLVANRRAVVLQSEFTPLVTFLMTTTGALIIYIGTRAALSGSLTPGELLVFLAYLRGMYTPVRQLAKLAGIVGRGQAAAERVTELLDTDEAVPEVRRPARLVRARGTLSFDNVSFAYPDSTPALTDITIEVPARTRLAVVGANGSGKSTLLRMIPRFIDPAAGVIRLDGVDLRELSLADLRRQIALVPQEPYLFRATVWQNITYSRDDLGRREAQQAARAAGVAEVIENFPDGYDTVLAERGANLSGGQRQCLVLARAMARDAPILLLDEPTTGLDVELEALLLDALERLGQGRTTLIISHQATAIGCCQEAAILANGRLRDIGTQAHLAAAGLAWWRQPEQYGRPAPHSNGHYPAPSALDTV